MYFKFKKFEIFVDIVRQSEASPRGKMFEVEKDVGELTVYAGMFRMYISKDA